MRLTLLRKLILVFSAILASVVVLNVMMNAFLLEKLYRSRKIDAMQESYAFLKSQYSENADEEVLKEAVKQVISTGNLRVFIWNSDDVIIIDSFPLLHSGKQKNEKLSQEHFSEQGSEPQNDGHAPRLKRAAVPRSELFIFDAPIGKENEIYKCDDYSIVMFGNFDDLEQKSLYLRGYLPDDMRVVIQMPIAAISEAVSISNTLMLATGIIMLIIGIVVVSVTSRTIAHPVKELSKIADSMQNLDFSRKYDGKRNDEIGSLGESINSLSSKLEDTIKELCEKNEQLQHDIELKSKIDTMRKEFIANASHELKTPIALISGYAEGLRDNIASDEQSRRVYTDVIIDEAERMNHIIHQMLDLMELDRAEEVLKREKLSLAALAEEAINSCELLAKNNGVTIGFEHVGDCSVYGDYGRIYQAVINYITNAINHADEKKTVLISVKDIDSKVRFGVYNTGKNIPKEETSNIWERFYKIDKAHTREYGGTGLGLSIVKSVIELHGGEYGVINEADGVEFYFILDKEKTR